MTDKQKKDRYSQSGVDIDAGKKFVEMIKPIVSKTFKSNVLSDLGSYAGLYSLNLGSIKKPILVSSTDGVGTKLKIAFMLDKHDTIGIDLVAMCVNDIIVQGAAPLFFLDYLSTAKLIPDTAVEIIKGISRGCKEAKCALIGGETAEMPGFYAQGEYDLAGFAIGLVDNDEIIDGSEIAIGHQLIGLSSSGLHSNGYSLVRKIFFDELNMSVHDHIDEFGKTIGEELLEPTRIYTDIIYTLIKNFHIYGIAHITGGGIVENLPRILPVNCQAVIRQSSWKPQPIFQFIKRVGKLSQEEMMRTFNNGIGLILVVAEKEMQDILDHMQVMGEKAYPIGWIKEREIKDSALEVIK
jgi:phosphoribosylformylglycinamidine cyclo-ligase